MNKILKYILPAAALVLSSGLTSCLNDLHVNPIDPSMQTDVEAEQLFNKCYANFGLAGNGGPDGDSDVDGIVHPVSSVRCGTATSSPPMKLTADGVTTVFPPIATTVMMPATRCCVATTIVFA